MFTGLLPNRRWLLTVIAATGSAAFVGEASANYVHWLQFPNWTSGDVSGVGNTVLQTVNTQFELHNGRFSPGQPIYDPGSSRPIVDPQWPFASRLLPSLAASSPGTPVSDRVISYSLNLDFGSGGFPSGGLLAVSDLEDTGSTATISAFIGDELVAVDWTFKPYLVVGEGEAQAPSWNPSTRRLSGTGESLLARENLVLMTSDRAFDSLRIDVSTTRNDQIRFSTGIVLREVDGDYNKDGIVDAADYSIWRDQLGNSGNNLAADGTGPLGAPDGVVDLLDHGFWKANFGKVGASTNMNSLSNANVPESTSASLTAILLFSVCSLGSLRLWARNLQ